MWGQGRALLDHFWPLRHRFLPAGRPAHKKIHIFYHFGRLQPTFLKPRWWNFGTRVDLRLPPTPNFCKNRSRGFKIFAIFQLLKPISLYYNVEILLKRRDLGIPQRHKISSELLRGFWTWPAGIALPRRWCILISSSVIRCIIFVASCVYWFVQ